MEIHRSHSDLRIPHDFSEPQKPQPPHSAATSHRRRHRHSSNRPAPPIRSGKMMLELLGTHHWSPNLNSMDCPETSVLNKTHGKIRLEEKVPGFPNHPRDPPRNPTGHPGHPRGPGPGKEVRFQFGLLHRLQKIHLRSLSSKDMITNNGW